MLRKKESLVPHRIIAARRTLCLLCAVLVAFKLGEMSVSFTGSQWAWMALAAFLIALAALSFDLLRTTWSMDST